MPLWATCVRVAPKRIMFVQAMLDRTMLAQAVPMKVIFLKLLASSQGIRRDV
jgi:hypothetical protein